MLPNIFNYLDYRDYLEDFYKEKKSHNPHFSFQMLATQAGFSSKSFLKQVIDGKKNLSESSITQLNGALKLNDKSLEFFKDLVAFNQARSQQLRTFYFDKLLTYNKRSIGRLLIQQQYDYFSQWYHSTIRELVCTVDFHDDYESLGTMVRPSIGKRQAMKSVELLQNLGLIRRDGNRFIQCDAIVTTGDEVRSLAVQNFHLQNLNLAGESISTTQSNQRDISCLIVGLSDEKFDAIKSEIQIFRKKILEIANDSSKIDRIYHINFQLFPTSEHINHDKS